MGSHAKVVITDYDGRSHNYVRFLDGYPDTADGFFGNFPRGSHAYRLDTFVRRLTLKERNDVDRLDYYYAYNINLVERTVSIDSCDHSPVVGYSFEEAIKAYAYPDYTEAHPGSPSLSDAENILFEVLFPLILKIINKAVSFPHLSRHYEPLGVMLCEDSNTYRFPAWIYNFYYNEDLTKDALSDVSYIIFLKKFKDKRNNSEISVSYRIAMEEKRFYLPGH